ncbi:MAG: hypothetical protein ACK2TV_05220, partial [Anaerolineales bacterium]
MHYRIFIFNSQSLGPINGEHLLSMLKASNFSTLCAQYGLNLSEIERALTSLSLMSALDNQISPFLLLRYQAQASARHLVLQSWPAESSQEKLILERALKSVHSETLKTALKQTREIVAIELSQMQLRDMGILLAYELARWVVEKGRGLMRGLDGNWYRLNGH